MSCDLLNRKWLWQQQWSWAGHVMLVTCASLRNRCQKTDGLNIYINEYMKLFLNRWVHHVGVCALSGLEAVVRFPRPAGYGDQSSTRNPDASFRTLWGKNFENILPRSLDSLLLEFLLICTSACTSQGYQVSLKSTRGPIDVFLCPEDSSGVCSPVTGGSPSKPIADPSLVQPSTQPTDQSQPRTCSTALEVGLSSPASTSSTVTAVSQQDPSSLVLGGDTGECCK